ncbi:MAG: Hint domain-containing protein [Proteobacteria bacterium]|nr:Hint domain-containing protein [Pseudomonadota bacterium]MBS0573536.1 Hint domain-containing protein [Pseudomonadota bacterium]
MHLPFSLPGRGAAATARPAPPQPAAARPAPEADRSWTLPGLCWNASVMTSFGALPVQVLRKPDPLRLSDGNVARIAWVDKIQLDEGFLAAYPDAQPILIRAGALGAGLPAQDLLVSPQQAIAVPGLNFRTERRIARDLLGRPGILRQPQTMLTYYLFHCGQPAEVMCEGLGLFTGP